MNYGNFTIVAGRGEGVNREVIAVGNDATGLDKHVIFVNARDLKNNVDLKRRGEEKLIDYKRVNSFESDITPKGSFEYEKDWDLGDIVTVENKGWGVNIDTKITEVTEVYETDGLRQNVTFGEAYLLS